MNDAINITATPKQAMESALHILRSGNTPFFIGGVGIGKSSIVREMVDVLADGLSVVRDVINPSKKQFGFIDLRLSLLESIDLGGIPIPEQVGDHWIQRRAFLGNLPTGGVGLLFLDEFQQAHPSVQTICSQLVYERRIGEYQLPRGWCIVCASNRASDRAGAHRMTSNNRSRVWEMTVKSSADDFLQYGSANGFHPDVLAYISYRQDALNQFDPKIDAPQTTPRGWEFISDVLNTDPPKELYNLLFAGFIGAEQAIEFSTFLSLKDDVPDLKAILTGKKVDVPDKAGLCYATICAILSVMKDAKDSVIHDWFSNALAYIERMPTPEFGILFVRQIANARAEVKESDSFVKFKVANQDLEI